MLLAVVHAGLMGALGLKLLADRARLPRGWARTAPYDPSTPLRGRYVRLALEIPLDPAPAESVAYRSSGVRLRSVEGKVVGQADDAVRSPRVQFWNERGMWRSRLEHPVAFFIPEHVVDPSIRPPEEQLWVEVTLPRAGPPRPIRLGVMRDGHLTPLDLR
jgi:hypothetical protein